MKKLALISFVIFLGSINLVSAQELGIYVIPSLGFGAGIGSIYFDSYDTYEWDGGYELTSSKDVYYNAGKGVKLNLTIGKTLTNNLAVEFQTGYSIGFASAKMGWSFIDGPSDGMFSETTIMGTSIIPFILMAQVKLPKIGPVIPYLGFGPGYYIGSEVEQRVYKDFDSEGEEILIKEEYNVSAGGIGLRSTAGVEYPLTETISLVGSMVLDTVSLTTSKWELTKYMIDGEDELDGLSEAEKNGIYEKDSLDNDAPWVFPANNLGINVGICMKF